MIKFITIKDSRHLQPFGRYRPTLVPGCSRYLETMRWAPVLSQRESLNYVEATGPHRYGARHSPGRPRGSSDNGSNELIPHANNARLHSESDIDRIADAGTVDQKTYWGLGEVVMWIRTRDFKRVASISELSETEAMLLAMFTCKMRLDPCSLRRLSTISDADREPVAPLDKAKATRIEGPIPMGPDIALDDLKRKLGSGRLQLTAIKHGRSSDEQIPVPSAELNDLVFRFTPDYRVAPVGLWSRTRGLLVWRSPQFLRSNVIRAWPALNTKTAAVSVAILRHLRKIVTPGAPLTKLEAQRRCMAEVSNAYPGAFKKAWTELEPSLKRGRGKHGSRMH